MTIQDLGSIGELIAALATVATLAYLALQIRQNTRFVRASTFRESTSRSADFSRAIAEQEDLARIYRIGLGGMDQLEDDDDRMRFVMLLSTLFRQYEDLFFQHQAGTVSSESWDAWRTSLRFTISNPGFLPFWDVRRLAFTESFRQFIDAECETEPLPTVAEISEKLKRVT